MLKRCAVVIAVIVTAAFISVEPASAAATLFNERLYSYVNATVGGDGVPLNGVSGKLYVDSAPVGITGHYRHIEMSTTDGQPFIQFGALQGLVKNTTGTLNYNNCSGTSQTVTSTTVFLIYYSPSVCSHEIAISLGVFGSTGNYRNFGLRRNSDGTYYMTLDQTTLFTLPATMPSGMMPNVGSDADDTCSSASLSAVNNGTPQDTLALYSDSAGWRYWSTPVLQYIQVSDSSKYGYGYYNGLRDTFFASGPASC